MKRKDCDKSAKCGYGLLLMALAGCLGHANEAWGGSITLYREAVVTGDEVRLSDVCQLRGCDTDESTVYGKVVVGESPIVGGSTIVTMAGVREALRQADVNLALITLQGATSCDVTRPRAEAPKEAVDETDKSPALRSQQARSLRQAIVEFFEQDLAEYGGQVHVQFGRTAEAVLDLRGPDFEFGIRRTSGKLIGLVGVDVSIRSAGRDVQVVPIMVNIGFSRQVVVTRRAINVGMTISPSDIALSSRTFSTTTDAGYGDVDAVVGQRAKRFISRGQVVEGGDLEPVPLVKRGQLVEVHSRVGGVVVVSAAKALEAGAYGDVVALRTSERGPSQFSAVVTGAGRVRLNGSEPMEAQLAMGGER